MEVLLWESHMPVSGPGLYCPHSLKFSFLCSSLVLWKLFEKPWQALELFEKKLEAASAEVPTSSLGSCFLQLSCMISSSAMLQQQPCLHLAMYPIDLDPNFSLQTWFCRLDLGPASSQCTCLATYTLDWPWLLSPDLPYPPHSRTVGAHPLLVVITFCLLCHDSQVLDCLPLCALAAPLHAAAKLHLSLCSVPIFLVTNPQNIDLYKNHKKKLSKIQWELSTWQHIPLHLRKG